MLHLWWIPHYHHTSITIFVIWKIKCLIHYGYLWLEELIPITVDLIHQIYWLPTKGNNTTAIAGESSDLGITDTMKAKYKLKKMKRGYVIVSIKDKAVHVATQLLARKLMRKCHVDEVQCL